MPIRNRVVELVLWGLAAIAAFVLFTVWLVQLL